MTEPKLPVCAQPAETERAVSLESEPVVESVRFSPCPEIEEQTEASQTNYMRVNLQTSGLNLELETQLAHNAPLIELNARVELLSSQLLQTEEKLERAWHRIGFLEAQAQQREQIIDHLCKQSNNS